MIKYLRYLNWKIKQAEYEYKKVSIETDLRLRELLSSFECAHKGNLGEDEFVCCIKCLNDQHQPVFRITTRRRGICQKCMKTFEKFYNKEEIINQ